MKNSLGVIALWILLIGAAVSIPLGSLYGAFTPVAFGQPIDDEEGQNQDNQKATPTEEDKSPLSAQITSNATEGIAPATFEFKADLTGGKEPYTFNWNFDDHTKEGDRKALLHTFKEGGTYNVTLTVTDATGESATDSMIIDVQAQHNDKTREAATDNSDTST
ncbi:MAG: PKD domain-containing protein, partial [Thermoproteota archaeon]|nr:PKD domain-containing protein [Thermoproteota archaeon]